MKMKLFLFAGLVIGSIGLSFLVSAPAYAVNEKYKWIDASTIQGSGGAYLTNVRKDNNTSAGTVTFKRDGTSGTYKANQQYNGTVGRSASGAGSECALQLALIINKSDGSTATTQQNNPGSKQCNDIGLDDKVTLANANDNAPDNLPATAVAEGDKGGEGDTKATDSCVIEGIGWIICPVARVMAKLVDGAYGFVSSLLKVQPLVTTGDEANVAVYNAWKIMRNFANVAFVIAFLILIFSQLTSIGLNNYGIKKMLPRLIVAAILVNVSFWICAIAIDISNILGASLNNLFQNAIPGVGTTGAGVIATGTGWVGITGLVLAGTGVTILLLYAVLSALLPALLAAMIAIVTVFLVLTLRQAIIILLVVISPLAFVAYLLPNTESMFKKWLALFKTMLLMYPVIAMIFGASALASTIVMQTADGPYKMAIQIMGALIAIIPLALTPVVMKTAGGVLNRFGGIVNNPNKGPVDKLRKKTEAYRDRRQAIAGTRRLEGTNMFKTTGERYSNSSSRMKRGIGKVASGVSRLPGASLANEAASDLTVRNLNVDQQNATAKKSLDTAKQDYIANRITKEVSESPDDTSDYARKIAGPTGDVSKLQFAAIAAQRKETADAIGNIKESSDFDPGSKGIKEMGSRLEAAIREGNTNEARAMQDLLMTSGQSGLNEWRTVMTGLEDTQARDDKTGTMTDVLKTDTVREMRSDLLGKHAAVKQSAVDINTFGVSGNNLSTIQGEASTYNMSNDEFVRQKPSTQLMAIKAGAVSPERATEILGNPELKRVLFVDDDDPEKDIATQLRKKADSQPSTPQTLNIQHSSEPSQPQQPAQPSQPQQPTSQPSQPTPPPQPQQSAPQTQPPAANPTGTRTSPSFSNQPPQAPPPQQPPPPPQDPNNF